MKFVCDENTCMPVLIPVNVYPGLLPIATLHAAIDILCKGNGLHVYSFTYGCNGLIVDCMLPEDKSAAEVRDALRDAMRGMFPVTEIKPLRVMTVAQALAEGGE